MGAGVRSDSRADSNAGGNGEAKFCGSGDGSYARLPHHFRVENLELTYSADASILPADATDPFGHLPNW